MAEDVAQDAAKDVAQDVAQDLVHTASGVPRKAPLCSQGPSEVQKQVHGGVRGASLTDLENRASNPPPDGQAPQGL